MFRARLFPVIAALLLLGASNAFCAQKIISFDNTVRGMDRKLAVESIGGSVIREFHLINAVTAFFPDTVKDGAIYTLRGVKSVENDVYMKWIEAVPMALPLSSVETSLAQIKAGEPSPAAVPTPETPKLFGKEEEIPWGVKRVRAQDAWKFTQGEGAKVAVIDTGVDYTHPDIQPNYVSGYNAINPALTPMDDHGHGTHVSGTVAAVFNDKGVAGVAPKASLYGVKVLDKNGGGQTSSILAGIEWAADNGINVINMSLGSRAPMGTMKDMVQAAHDKGVAIICAAGNDSGPVNYPARYPGAIAVSASDNNDRIAGFSSRGPEIAFIAPGVNIPSTFKGGAYKTMSGTSMASPHVAGLATLVAGLGIVNPDDIKGVLIKSSVLMPGLKPTDQGNGMIDAGKMAALLYYYWNVYNTR